MRLSGSTPSQSPQQRESPGLRSCRIGHWVRTSRHSSPGLPAGRSFRPLPVDLPSRDLPCLRARMPRLRFAPPAFRAPAGRFQGAPVLRQRTDRPLDRAPRPRWRQAVVARPNSDSRPCRSDSNADDTHSGITDRTKPAHADRARSGDAQVVGPTRGGGHGLRRPSRGVSGRSARRCLPVGLGGPPASRARLP